MAIVEVQLWNLVTVLLLISQRCVEQLNLASSAGNSYIKARVKDWYGGQKGEEAKLNCDFVNVCLNKFLFLGSFYRHGLIL